MISEALTDAEVSILRQCLGIRPGCRPAAWRNHLAVAPGTPAHRTAAALAARGLMTEGAAAVEACKPAVFTYHATDLGRRLVGH